MHKQVQILRGLQGQESNKQVASVKVGVCEQWL